ALNPASEDAHCAAMRLFAAKGQPSSVLRQYQELESALDAEMGEKPAESTRSLMESLVQSGQRARGERDVAAPTLEANTSLPGSRYSPPSVDLSTAVGVRSAMLRRR